VLCHSLFRFFWLLRGLFMLSNQHRLDGDGFDFFPDSFPFEKTVEG
jgi:hypothetical protein